MSRALASMLAAALALLPATAAAGTARIQSSGGRTIPVVGLSPGPLSGEAPSARLEPTTELPSAAFAETPGPASGAPSPVLEQAGAQPRLDFAASPAVALEVTAEAPRVLSLPALPGTMETPPEDAAGMLAELEEAVRDPSSSTPARTADLISTLGRFFDLSSLSLSELPQRPGVVGALASAAVRPALGRPAASEEHAPEPGVARFPNRPNRRAAFTQRQTLVGILVAAALALALVLAVGWMRPLSPEARQARENVAKAAQMETALRGPRDLKARSIERAFPNARPIPFEETKNFVPLSYDKNPIFEVADLIRDFHKNKEAGQEAILLVLKTELCCTNIFRPCAVATAALEHRTAPDVAKFRLYGAWVKNAEKAQPGLFNDEVMARMMAAKKADWPRLFPKQISWLRWSASFEDYYDFDQGPGANFFFINPNVDLADLERNPIRDVDDAIRRGILIRSDADRLGLSYDERGEIDWNGGLQRELDRVRRAFGLK